MKFRIFYHPGIAKNIVDQILSNRHCAGGSTINAHDTAWLNSDTLNEVVTKSKDADYVVWLSDAGIVHLQIENLLRAIETTRQTNALILYANYYERNDHLPTLHRLIACQQGAVRDDFDFGPIRIIDTSLLKKWGSTKNNYKYSAWYSLWLIALETNNIVLFPEPLTVVNHAAGAWDQFGYVDPRNREVQIEREVVCTAHLNKIGAAVYPPFLTINPNEGPELMASVIIPVKNRVKTVEDAVKSALAQAPPFEFNVIVVDNYSTDGTTELLRNMAESDTQLVHVVPPHPFSGIGGCWNFGVNHPLCGRFAVQLDSDDIYIDQNTLGTVVAKFFEEACAMVVGSYTLTDMNLNILPPGVIDHREWTDENGANNALRINGLGAPRAFYTPVLRKIGFPDVSYGEDYAVGLAISSKYKIGRIYNSLYLCRRWEGNSDAGPSAQKLNEYNSYKDFLRTVAIAQRVSKNNVN